MNNISMGINIGHDRSVAVVKNGKLIGSLAQERVDRKKHSTGLTIPYDAIEVLLNYLGVGIDEIKYIGLSSTAVDIPELESFFFSQFATRYNHYDFKFIPVTHHLAHAAASYYTSGFNEALIFIADGGGDVIGNQEESESVFWGNNNSIQLLERRLQSNYIHTMTRPQMHLYPFMNKACSEEQISIGKKYSQFTSLLQLGAYGEGKTMGLASYGKSLINFNLPQQTTLDFQLSFEDILKEIYQIYTCSGEPYFEFMRKHNADIARTIQEYTEKQIMTIVDYLVQKYNPQNLCLGGGLFLNCPVNHNILQKYPYLNLHICPAAGDDGQAIGAAFEASKFFCTPIYNSNIPIPYLGVSYTSQDIETALKEKNMCYSTYPNDELASIVAKYIYNNKIVGVLRGRSEIGPRALCHRSILANPCNPKMKDYINSNVKHRENFRPFAPVVTYEEQFEIFELEQDSPYMLLAPKVKSDYIPKLPSITHVDGSARVQAIKKSDNEFVYNILKNFEKLSGVPVLINTSFNDFNEPIVESPTDAIRTFLNTKIDVLVLENYLILKSDVF